MTENDKFDLEVGRAIRRAADELPGDWRMNIVLSGGVAEVKLVGPDWMVVQVDFDPARYIVREIENAVAKAKELS